MKSENPVFKAASWAARVLPLPVKKMLYGFPPIAKLIRRSLNAAAPKSPSEITIAAGPARGLKMILDLKIEKDYWLGTYEIDLQNAARKLIHPGDIVYDVGANIGYISLMSAQLCGENGRVFSFEALPANFERLQQNVSLNAFQSRITSIHAAVIGADRPVTFLTHLSGAMGKALGSEGRDADYTGEITVPGLSLDTFVHLEAHPQPDVIKLDIEGGEGNALTGMQLILKEKRPVIMIELHGEKAAKDVWHRLQEHKYKFHRMKRGFPRVNDFAELDWKAYVIALP